MARSTNGVRHAQCFAHDPILVARPPVGPHEQIALDKGDVRGKARRPLVPVDERLQVRDVIHPAHSDADAHGALTQGTCDSARGWASIMWP
jgi:hypothetical protein